MAKAVSFRPGSTRIHVKNEGRIVVLYDEQNREAIAAAGALDAVCTREGVASPPLDDATRLAATAAVGSLVVYQVDNDADVRLEVAVGPPLTDRERGTKVAWLERQRSILSLPSGALCIETSPALRINPPPRRLQEVGGRLLVPPGNYVLTLDRVALASLDADRSRSIPTEVVTLTSRGSIEAPVNPAAFLSIWEAFGERPLPEPGPVKARAFAGTLSSCRDATVIGNLNGEGAAALGLRFGSRIEVSFGGKRAEAAWLGRLTAGQFQSLFGPELHSLPWLPPPPHLVAWLEGNERAAGPVLHLRGGDLGRDRKSGLFQIAGHVPMSGMPFALRSIVPPCLASLAAPVAPVVDGPALRCLVAAAAKRSLVLHAGRTDLARIGAGPGAVLTALFPDGSSRPVLYEGGPGALHALAEKALALTKKEGALVGRLRRSKEALFGSAPALPWDHPRMAARRAKVEQIDRDILAIRYTEHKVRRAPLSARVQPHFDETGELLVLSSALSIEAGESACINAVPGSHIQLTVRPA